MKLTKKQKEVLNQLATTIMQAASMTDHEIQTLFGVSRKQASFNHATLLKHFAETN